MHERQNREQSRCSIGRKGQHSSSDRKRKILNVLTSAMESSSLAMVSRRLSLAFSMASSLTNTASILDTILPMECSIRSTRRLRLKYNNTCWPGQHYSATRTTVNAEIFVENNYTILQSELENSCQQTNSSWLSVGFLDPVVQKADNFSCVPLG